MTENRNSSKNERENSQKQTSNSCYITYGLKNYSERDVWSKQVAEKSVYAVWDYNIVMQEAVVHVRCG